MKKEGKKISGKELLGFGRELGRKYTEGEYIFRQGDPADSLHVVIKGKVELVLDTTTGEKQLGVLKKGDIFGATTLFAKRSRYSSARAIGSARTMRMEAKTFISRFHQDPSLAFRVLQQMAARIYALDHELTFRLRDHGAPEGEYNYNKFQELDKIIHEEIERVRILNQILALIVVEIADLPKFIAKHGKTFSEQLQKSLSEVMRQQLRSSDIITRLGENGFGLLLYEADGMSASNVMLKLREAFHAAIEQSVEIDTKIAVDIRCGLAIFPEHDDSADLLESARVALATTAVAGNDWIALSPPRYKRVHRVTTPPQKGSIRQPRGSHRALAMAKTLFGIDRASG